MAKRVKPPRATLDAETRSQRKLDVCGGYRYVTDPTTEVLVWAFRLPHWKIGRTEIWTPEYPQLGITKQGGDFDALLELFDWIASGGLLEAHNAQFDRGVWEHIMVPQYGWPEIPFRQWRCSAAQAAACALPRGLDEALAAMRLALRKDADGAKVMMKMTKPRKPRKAERLEWAEQHGDKPMDVLYHENRHLLMQLFDYVRQDVLAEEGISHVLPDLSSEELELYHLDQILNDRGFQLDMEAVEAALYLIEEELTELHAEISELTDGQIERPTQRQRLLIWFDLEGLPLENTQAATIEDTLNRWAEFPNATPKAKRVLEILNIAGGAAIKKYYAMRDVASADGRVRGGLLYHGASTGRWTGKLVQPQNFPKGCLKVPDPEVEAPGDFVNRLWETIKTLDRPRIRETFNASVLDVLSHALRSAIVARDGYELFVADYASIEARVVLWLAGDEEALDVFRQGKDIYLYTAEGIYKRPLTKADKTERQMGKQAVLGLGYQMGVDKFVDTLAKYGIVILKDHYCDRCGDGEFAASHINPRSRGFHRFEYEATDNPDEITAARVVRAYREKYWRTVEFWKEVEATAIQCVKTKRPVECGQITWLYENEFLWCELPSGRRLAYPFPWVSMQETAWGSQKETLQFKTVNPKTRQWGPQKTYGGMLTENITQAVSRDLIAAALKRLEAHPVYEPILSVHDEAIAEAPIGMGDVHEFERLVAELPEWAEGIPVAAEGWKGLRYRK